MIGLGFWQSVFMLCISLYGISLVQEDQLLVATIHPCPMSMLTSTHCQQVKKKVPQLFTFALKPCQAKLSCLIN